MLTETAVPGNWLRQTLVRFLVPLEPVPLERPSLSQLAQPGARLPRFVADCAVARKYLDLLGPLDWEHFPERDPRKPWPGPRPAPRAPYVAAFLVKLEENKPSMRKLRDFLVEHPALVWSLGFPLVPSSAFDYGFDVQASLPSPRQFGRILRTLPNPALQFLLDGAVARIRCELPEEVPFGDVVAGDTKHIIAFVKENNPKVFIEDRYDKTKRLKGDPDCRLGCKKKHNRGPADEKPVEGAAADSSPPEAPPGGTPTTNPIPASNLKVGEYYWGYASGVVATQVPGWGEFVLAELTQTFDKSDVSYFFPLMGHVERRLGRRPRFGAFDMAFDAHYVFDYFHEAGGFAAVLFSQHGGITRQFDEAGLPLCQVGLPMPLKSTYFCRTAEVPHERGRYACPLLFPEPTGEVCPVAHKNWAKDGCIVTMPTSPGARIRYQLDRESEAFKAIYRQRTADERINSQAKALGIERPNLRNRRSIANHNTLIYVLICLRGVQRIRARKLALSRAEGAELAREEATHALN
jgi:hypothetical protein